MRFSLRGSRDHPISGMTQKFRKFPAVEFLTAQMSPRTEKYTFRRVKRDNSAIYQNFPNFFPLFRRESLRLRALEKIRGMDRQRRRKKSQEKKKNFIIHLQGKNRKWMRKEFPKLNISLTGGPGRIPFRVSVCTLNYLGIGRPPPYDSQDVRCIGDFLKEEWVES